MSLNEEIICLSSDDDDDEMNDDYCAAATNNNHNIGSEITNNYSMAISGNKENNVVEILSDDEDTFQGFTTSSFFNNTKYDSSSSTFEKRLSLSPFTPTNPSSPLNLTDCQQFTCDTFDDMPFSIITTNFSSNYTNDKRLSLSPSSNLMEDNSQPINKRTFDSITNDKNKKCKTTTFTKQQITSFIKRAKGKYSNEEILIYLDNNLIKSVGGNDIYIYLSDNFKKDQIITKINLPISFTIEWKRKLPIDYCKYVLEQINSINLIDKYLNEEYLNITIPYCCIRMTGDNFIDLYQCNQLDNYLDKVINNLKIESKKSILQYQLYKQNKQRKEYLILFLIEGLNDYIKKLEKEQYNKLLQKQLNKKNDHIINTLQINMNDIEKYKIKLELKFGKYVKFVESKNCKQTMEFIVNLTKNLMEAPYKKQTTIIDFLHTNSDGNGRQTSFKEIWKRQLMEIPSVSQKIAETIMNEYPTVNSLLTAYDECKSEKKYLLSDLECLFKVGEGSNKRKETRKKVGKKASKAVYEVFCCNSNLKESNATTLNSQSYFADEED
ncbi:hypothetical protein ABK040_012941 [Willaertia magna]